MFLTQTEHEMNLCRIVSFDISSLKCLEAIGCRDDNELLDFALKSVCMA